MKKSLLIFSFLVSSITVFGQTSQANGKNWEITSGTPTGGNPSKIILDGNTADQESHGADLIFMTGGGYGRGGDIKFESHGNFMVNLKSNHTGLGNINMKTNEFNLDANKINLTGPGNYSNPIEISSDKTLNLSSSLTLDTKAYATSIESEASTTFKSSSMHIDTQTIDIKSQYDISMITEGISLIPSLYLDIQAPRFKMKNANSYFSLNPSGQFFMFNNNNTTNTVNEFIVSGLDVTNYKLFVQGGILTEEVRVQTNWADYVFNHDYKLKTLEEVEKYIDTYGHLPNVPSAEQVEKTGIELGEITKIQQEKIEELTLYTIAQEKKIKAQEERLAKLEALLLKK